MTYLAVNHHYLLTVSLRAPFSVVVLIRIMVAPGAT